MTGTDPLTEVRTLVQKRGTSVPPPRKTLIATLCAALAAATLTQVDAASAAVNPAHARPAPSYTIGIGTVGTHSYQDDTPASSFIDQDGSFHFQESDSEYGATGPRDWSFYSGTNFGDATYDASTSTAVNPANPRDKNGDTTWRCNNGPTGVASSYDPDRSSYTQKDFCDLLGTWVDPDTGDWYGLVHNEFTPQPFGDGWHYDGIDYAVSHDQGKTWAIEGHAITSPYSTTRGDDTAFPNQTYDYGDGDQRLFVDYASGYFYVYYASRVIPKGGQAGAMDWLAHVARAPISGKMAGGTWQKWYDGRWSQPGIGGKESDMEPVGADYPLGYVPPGKDYNPANPGTTDQQITAGTLPAKSPIAYMNITYDAYLGLYIGQPAVTGDTGPQQYYATDDLATQRWHLIGDTGAYTSGSWYRWIVDDANLANQMIVGKSFRAYCSVACHSSDGEWADTTIDSTAPAPAPFDLSRTYRIASGDHRVLMQQGADAISTSHLGRTNQTSWKFTPTGDGAYTITNVGSGQALGVDSTNDAGRAWGAKPTVTAIGAGGPTVGQEWFLVRDTAGNGGKGTFRLVNRYSGLVLGLSSDDSRSAETAPERTWTNVTGSPVGGDRSAAEQTISFLPN